MSTISKVDFSQVKAHSIELNWHKQGEFSAKGWDRRHQVNFHSDVGLATGCAHNDFGADPEQLLAAAVSSCHMQTFVSLAAKKRLVVEHYQDNARAYLAQRDDGHYHVAKIVLSPRVVFSGDKVPDDDTIAAMHEKSHHHCFIANSLAADTELLINLNDD